MQKKYYKEILKIIKEGDPALIKKGLLNYHESDIAHVLEGLSKDERLKIYSILGIERVSEVFSHYDSYASLFLELDHDMQEHLLEALPSNLSIDIIDSLDDEAKDSILSSLKPILRLRLNKLNSYPDDTIGSEMSDNFIYINKGTTVKGATSQVIKMAGSHDNIFNIYVIDDDFHLVGSIDLRDLIVARVSDDLDSLIMKNTPFLNDFDLISEAIGRIKEYNEQSLPVLNSEGKLIGVIDSDSILDLSEEEMQDDYNKLGGIINSEDMNEDAGQSIKKRLPWLIILLFLGFIVSSVIGSFEVVISSLPIIVFFQSMILDMSGNVGTQSLAVTIRNISDESFKRDKKKQRRAILKELRIGFFNGLIMGFIAFIFVLIYLVVLHKEIRSGMGYEFTECLLVSMVIGLSMLFSILLSSIIGTSFPLLLDKLNIDPAVASGPFITTINDVIAVVVYYGLTYIIFMLIL